MISLSAKNNASSTSSVSECSTAINLSKKNGDGNSCTGLTSIGIEMPSAFTVSNSPITGTGGTFVITGAGDDTQYIKGDGTLGVLGSNFITAISNTADINLTVSSNTLSALFASDNISQFTNDSGYLTSADLSTYTPTARTLTINSTTFDLSANRTWNVGTVTSVAATPGTGISISGSPITTSGSLTITNTAPDQTVVLTNGAGISITGTYPSFTITNTASGGGTVTSVSGTSNRITSTGGATPVIDISSSYVGQSSITTLGTISTGIWNAGAVTSSGAVTGTSIVKTGGTSAQILLADGSTTDFASVVSGGQVVIFEWKFQTTVGVNNPGNGFWRADSAVGSSVATISIADITANTAIDISALFQKVKGDWLIHIQQSNDATKFIQFTTSTAYTDHTTWWEIPVTYVQDSGFPLANSTRCTFVFVNQNNKDGLVSSVTGTTNRITSTGGVTPVIDISASYVGQASITTLGTISTGVWQGTAIADTYISSSTNWNTAFSQTRQWDGGATGLVAATGRTSLGATTVGGNFFTLSNPSAITFPRINADNSVSTLDAATFRTAIGASAVTPAALTKTDDTNVTLTLGGTPTTALLQATSLTLGWTGTLATSRGGTGTSSATTINGTSITYGTTNTITAAAGTLTGTTLNSTVVTSSLTSVGTIATGVWNGTALTSTYLPATTVYTGQANSYTAGMKQTFTSNATTAGLNLAPLTGNPSSLFNGDMWYNTSTTAFNYKIGGNIRTIVNLNEAQTLTNKTWNGVVIGSTYGGTGINNGSSTITLGGNFTTSGAFNTTITVTGTTTITLPTSGTLVNSAVTTLSSLVSVGTITTGVWNGTKIGLAYGGTNADLSATGGTSNYLKQSSTGAAITVGTIPASDIASGAALTKTDDTNVTLTLGGSPTTALLAASSLTLGWTGTLSGTRGGTGVNNGSSTITLGGNLTTSGAFNTTLTVTAATSVTLPTTGTLATLAGSETFTTKTIAAGSNTITGLTNTNLSGTAGITVANLSYAANTFAGNVTGSTAAPTGLVIKDVAEQTYTGTIVWSGGGAPSGSTTHRYRWSQVHNTVTVAIQLSYSVAGATNTQVLMDIPTDCPAPTKPTGFTAGSDILYWGSGAIGTATTTPAGGTRAGLASNSGNTGFQLFALGNSASAKTAWVTVTYFIN